VKTSANRTVPLVLAVIAAFLAPLAQPREVTATFPGAQSELASPDGTMRIVNHDPDDNDHPHVLLLTRPGLGDKTLHEYGRHVRVTWAPDSKHVAITDYEESTDATCLIVDILAGTKTDLRAVSARDHGVLSNVLSNEHAYLECQDWLSSDQISFKAHGWGTSDPSGRELYGVYALNGKVRLKSDGS
jgi:hypothetical protein